MIDRIIEVIDADNRSTRLISTGIMKWTFDNNLDFLSRRSFLSRTLE